MDISQFELVFKPQAPAGPADIVLQGYFLEISNLEARDLEFALKLTTSSINDPTRSLFANAAVFVDTPSVNNNIGVFNFTGALADESFQLDRNIFVPAGGTALVAVLPSAPFAGGMGPAPDPNFECRGLVTLSLPIVTRRFDLGGGIEGILIAPQGNTPQKVMLTAQNRAVFTDPDTGTAKGQTQAGLPLATGQALNEIDPDPLFALPTLPFDLTATERMIQSGISLEEGLASMLATAQHSKLDLKKFNAALKKSGVGMAIETRKL